MKFIFRFLRNICPAHLYEEIEGDLIQKFKRDVTNFGEKRAKRRLLWNVIRFCRPGIVFRNRFFFQLINANMIRNYCIVSFRNIRTNPLHSFLTIFSLAIGFASCLVIYLFIAGERSFDDFHTKRSLIYRLYEVPHFSGTGAEKVALTMGGMGPAMASDYPEVASFTRYWNKGKMAFNDGETQFIVNNVAAVDSTFLNIFNFTLKAGDPATALQQPNSLLLTEEIALKFFDNASQAVGRAITIQGVEFKITGVLHDLPDNSHLQFDALQSISTYVSKIPTFNSNWDENFLNTYLLVHPGADLPVLESKFSDFMFRHTGKKDIGDSYSLYLQPLKEVHLNSTDIAHDYNNYRKFNGTYLTLFEIVGVLILLIAGVNFMNLTIARASHRWKEIGVRTSIGAKKRQLFGQFIFESALLSIIALVVAILLDFALIPSLNQLVGRQLVLSSLLDHPLHIASIGVITVLLGLLTGVYPSFYMTSFNMASVLKGIVNRQRNSVFRNALVVLQFGLAVAMIECTIVVMKQLSFMENTEMGFVKEQIMLLDMNDEVNQKFETLKAEWLRDYKLISGVTASGQRLGNNFNSWGFKIKLDTGIYRFTPSNVNVDYDYLNVYGIKLKEGRSFQKDFINDKGRAFIINETMVSELGIKEPIGTPAGHAWYENDSLGAIIGVAKDFNFNSFHHKINTLALVCHPEWGYNEISIKIDGTQAQEAIAAIKKVWEANVSSYPFNYSFLDDHFDALYRSDQQMGSIVTIMAFIAILISCIGLFGLAAISMERKTKEIGIRKALGASGSQIAALLSENFAKLIFIAFILVSPGAYFLLSRWLENFAYKITLHPLLFLAGGLIAFVIALLTISYHTLKATRENPVRSLRYE